MNKLPLLLILLLLVCNYSISQDKTSALRDAKITSIATLKEDFSTVLKHTYPSVLDLMGGKEKGVELLESTFEQMRQGGFVFEKADVIKVSDVVFEQEQYRCYVESFNQMRFSETRIKSKSYLLGIYDDAKKIWYFLEAKQLKNKEMLDQVLPDFKTSLVIPEDQVKQEPIKG